MNGKTAKITVIGMFVAMASVLSGMPIGITIFGIPATLQTFAMSFLGFMLGKKYGVAAVIVYILTGLIGLPVFSNFTSGFSILFGMTGGFLTGFIFLAFFCGIAADTKKSCLKILLPATGLVICHLSGFLQFSFITRTQISAAITAVSLPYLPKDIISIFFAYYVAKILKKIFANAKINIFNH